MQLLDKCQRCEGKTSPMTAKVPTYYDTQKQDWQKGYCPDCEGTGKVPTEEGKQVIELYKWVHETRLRRL